MKTLWIWIIILSIVSIYNAVYNFLPRNLQDNKRIKSVGIVAALLLLIYGIGQIISNLSYSYATVSEEGSIIESRNFPWKVTKVGEKEEVVYIINECLVDISMVDVKATKKAATVNKHNALDGVVIKFVASGFGNPVLKTPFKVEIKK